MQTLDEAATSGYRSLGLLANPFVPRDDDSSDPIGVRLTIRAASLRLLSVVEFAAADPDRRPIVVETSMEVPPYYGIAASVDTFAAMAAGNPVAGLLQAYVPLDMMRIGRVRAPLGIIAERVSGPGVDLTIAAWSRIALSEPDTELPEWPAIADIGVDGLIGEVDADPASFTARVFGELARTREGADDTEALMRIATARTGRLEADPSADESDVAPSSASMVAGAPEDPTDDPMAEAFVTPLGETAETEPDAEVAPLTPEELVAAYIIAYTKEHLSPVVARGLRAYVAQGTDSMAQELKVTKAPTKTLAALLRFAETRARLGVLMYDNFSIWGSVPAELRLKIIATLSQMRWTLKEHAVVVLFLTPGSAPEVEEAFAAAHHVIWDFEELWNVTNDACAFDESAARVWLKSAALDAEAPAWADALLGAVAQGTEIEPACAALATAIDEAAETGEVPDPAVVIRLLAADGAAQASPE